MKGAVNPGSECCRLKSRTIQVEKHEATAMSSKDHKDSCMKTPTAIPINVPLKPYSPFFISSRP